MRPVVFDLSKVKRKDNIFGIRRNSVYLRRPSYPSLCGLFLSTPFVRLFNVSYLRVVSREL